MAVAAIDWRTVTTLDQLAIEVRREHTLVLESGTAMIEHACLAGAALLAAKEKVPRGGWERWLQENFPSSIRIAYNYMRLARHRDRLMEIQPTTITAALKVLAGAPDARIDDDLIGKARQLYRNTDRTQAQVAAELGVTKAAVWNWVNPDKVKIRNAKAANRTMAAKREESRRARQAAVKRKGGEIAVAYSHVRKALEALERAAEGDEKAEVKRHISGAMQRLYGAEDEIGKAVRLG